MEFVLPNVCTCSKLNWMTNFLTSGTPLITMCKSRWLRLGYNGCKIATDHHRVVRFGGPDDNQLGPLKWDRFCFILQPAAGPLIWPSCAGPSGSVQIPESLLLSWPHQGSGCQPPITRQLEQPHLRHLLSLTSWGRRGCCTQVLLPEVMRIYSLQLTSPHKVLSWLYLFMVPSWCRFVRCIWYIFLFFLPPSFSQDWGVHSKDTKLPHYILHSIHI